MNDGANGARVNVVSTPSPDRSSRPASPTPTVLQTRPPLSTAKFTRICSLPSDGGNVNAAYSGPIVLPKRVASVNHTVLPFGSSANAAGAIPAPTVRAPPSRQPVFLQMAIRSPEDAAKTTSSFVSVG